MTSPGGSDELIGLLKESILDELTDYGKYTSMAMQARGLGLPGNIWQDLESIAADERRHGQMLELTLSQVEQAAGYTQPGPSYGPSGYGPPSYGPPGSRPFPSTTTDWMQLANDIVAVKPDLQMTTDEAMTDIQADNQYARGSKIVLTNLARELGIK